MTKYGFVLGAKFKFFRFRFIHYLQNIRLSLFSKISEYQISQSSFSSVSKPILAPKYAFFINENPTRPEKIFIYEIDLIEYDSKDQTAPQLQAELEIDRQLGAISGFRELVNDIAFVLRIVNL